MIRIIKDILKLCITKYYSKVAELNSTVTYHGVRIPTSSDVFGEEVKSRFVTGEYESREAKVIKKYLEGKLDVIDLGASTGFTTVLAEKSLHDNCTVIAVEANPSLIPVLKK
jgi:hypothetical protein